MAMTSTYTVTGMTCSHCVHAVTEEISALHAMNRLVQLGGVTAAELATESSLPDVITGDRGS